MALSSGETAGWDDSATGDPVEWLPVDVYESLFRLCGLTIRDYEDLFPMMRMAFHNDTEKLVEARRKVPQNWCYAIWKLTKN